MSSSTPKFCFNSSCKEVSDIWRRGWRRRTGDYAHLCDRCALVYENGKFCETFHLNSSGWRCCESCEKQIHCGCIVSFHMFVLLDAGGIECLTCAKKSYILTPNPAWPPPSHFLPSQPEKMDPSGKSCSTIAGSGLVPRHQASNIHCGSDTRSNAHPRVPFGINASGSIDRYHSCDRPSPASCEMRQQLSYERLISGNLRLHPSEAPQSGNSGISMKEQSYTFPNDLKPKFLKNFSSSNLTLVPTSSRIETDNTPLSALLSQPQAISIPVGKPANHCGMGSSGESQIRNGKVQVDAQGRNQLLPRYRPHITNEELQQISSDSKSVIIPLFEKMLSASDAGRIGRLVLPKKCAETYFPPIAQPEGLPLQVQDVKGKEWVFQFRFWPNNNSRMYVLEGITPCIQSMQLQAGDVVTFSRLEPEGKLVMGGRKASAIPFSDQGGEATVAGNDASNPGDAVARNNCGDLISVNGHMKDKIHDHKPSIHIKRKNGGLGTKSKRFRFEEDMIELKLTWKEAQGLMRPPDEIVPSSVVVEGCEFEEFEDAEPIIGRPTLPGVDHFGEKIQWVQCEDCFKWRKVPADALLPSRWICADNVWDLDRSNCSATEELAKEQFDHMLHSLNKDSSEKEITDQDSDLVVPLEGLDTDTLANLAIQDKGESLPGSSENRTKHTLHKNGCTCIVCLHPPSGRNSKHKQSCDCIVCSSLRLRFKTLMERQERKLLEREAEPSAQNSQKQQQSLEKVQDLNPCPGMNTVSLDEARNSRKPSHLPLKGQIDLNIQPEREEECSPGSDSGPMKQHMAFLQQERPLDLDVLEI